MDGGFIVINVSNADLSNPRDLIVIFTGLNWLEVYGRFCNKTVAQIELKLDVIFPNDNNADLAMAIMMELPF